MKLARFRSTSSAEGRRSLNDYVAAMKENQKAIFYMAGDDRARLEASPQLEGFRARGVEVLLLADPVDSFWVTGAPQFDGKPFKSVTQGAADLTEIPLPSKGEKKPERRTTPSRDFIAFVKTSLGEAVSDVRESDRLTESAVCLVAPEHGPDRQFERLLQGAGRLVRRPSRSSRSTRATSASSHWQNSATRTRRSATTSPTCSTTRRACSTATSRSTPGLLGAAGPADDARATQGLVPRLLCRAGMHAELPATVASC